MGQPQVSKMEERKPIKYLLGKIRPFTSVLFLCLTFSSPLLGTLFETPSLPHSLYSGQMRQVLENGFSNVVLCAHVAFKLTPGARTLSTCCPFSMTHCELPLHRNFSISHLGVSGGEQVVLLSLLITFIKAFHQDPVLCLRGILSNYFFSTSFHLN